MSKLKVLSGMMLIILTTTVLAQNDSIIDLTRNRDNRFFFGFQGGLAVASPLKINNLEGPKKVRNTPAPGYEWGIKFGWVRDQRHYVSIGLKIFDLNHALDVHSNYGITGDRSFFSPFLNKLSTWNFLSFPFNYEYAIKQQKNSSININGGVTLNTYPSFLSSYSYNLYDSTIVRNTIFRAYLYGDKTTRATAQLGMAWYFSLFKFQDCRVGLEYNHSFRELRKGEYLVDENDPDYSYGTLSASGSYLALNASYMFTGIKKHKNPAKPKFNPLDFPKFDIGFGFTGNFHPGPDLSKETGNQKLLTKSAISFEGGPSLQCRLSNRYSIHTGIRYGAIPVTYGYDYPANLINGFPNAQRTETKMGGMTYWKIPLTFEASIFKSKPINKLTITTGIEFQYFDVGGGGDFAEIYSADKKDTLNLYNIEIDLEYAIFPNYTLGLAYYLTLFRPADLRVHLNYNISTATAVSGQYEILRETPQYTRGKYEMNNNHLTFGLNYYFRKKIRE